MPSVFDVIRGKANYVMKSLGKGHTENVYHKALITAMNKAGIVHRSEVSCPIWFMGECVGFGRADLVVGNVVVEIKANKLPPKSTSAQLKKYLESLAYAEKKTFQGMVVNFNQKNGCVDVFKEPFSEGNTSEVFERSTKKDTELWRDAPRMFKRKALLNLKKGRRG
jgi:GxxExxY protein